MTSMMSRSTRKRKYTHQIKSKTEKIFSFSVCSMKNLPEIYCHLSLARMKMRRNKQL